MGTSTSFRSPTTPRWQALQAAYTLEDSLPRLRSELFNAGEGWEEALASEPVAVFARALAEVWSDLPDHFASGDATQTAITSLFEQTRRKSEEVGFSPALAVAERAFQVAILSAATSGAALSDVSLEGARAGWLRRGNAPEAISIYLRQVLEQFARHVVARDVGRIVGSETLQSVESVGSLINSVANEVGSVVDQLGAQRSIEKDVVSDWPNLVRKAFSIGRELPTSRNA